MKGYEYFHKALYHVTDEDWSNGRRKFSFASQQNTKQYAYILKYSKIENHYFML